MATMPDITISFEPKALEAIETLAAATAAIKVNADAISSMREVEARMRSAEAERDSQQRMCIATMVKLAATAALLMQARDSVEADLREVVARTPESRPELARKLRGLLDAIDAVLADKP